MPRSRGFAAVKHGVVLCATTAVLAAVTGFGIHALGEWQALRTRSRVDAWLAQPAAADWDRIDPDSELGSRLVELVANSDPERLQRWGAGRREPLGQQIRNSLPTLGGRVTVHGWRPYRDSFGRYVVCFECDYVGTTREPWFAYEADLDRRIVRSRTRAEGDRTEGNVLGAYYGLALLLLEAAIVLGWQWIVLRTWDGTRQFLSAIPHPSSRIGQRPALLRFPYRLRPS